MRQQLLCTAVLLCLAVSLQLGSASPIESELDGSVGIAVRDYSKECGSPGCCKKVFSLATGDFICAKCCMIKVGVDIAHAGCSKKDFCICRKYGVNMCVKCTQLKARGCE